MFRFNLKSHAMVAALLLCVCGNVLSQQAPAPAGRWDGVIRSDTARVHVDANFNPKLASLHFDEPFNCSIDASFLEADKDGSHYTFKPSVNGGQFCQGLYPGELLVSTPSATALSLSLKNKKAAWTGTLTPTQAAH
ncbi:hypothetical protein [Rhodanobacter sp. MP1X3]|uniref:hypothetical protein n=1 Tax=Rhodanobacter sp. MP1X3 TaxID=2723086 RepID=UPI00161F5409|nr:hypothetical protein [Rhodanobacter sp. MP1X3]MBB6244348.1 hypothetical protein [Rhodanobacter sp. MP1X3]